MSRNNIINTINSAKGEVHKVKTPDWGEDVYVKVLSAKEWSEAMLFAKNSDDENFSQIEFAAKLCALGITDKDGKRLFKSGDWKTLLDGRIAPLNACSEKILKVNNLSEDDKKK